jgi:hypothetical protein
LSAREAIVPAYFVAENEITNETGFAPCRAVNATIAQYGGHFLTRGGATEGCGFTHTLV